MFKKVFILLFLCAATVTMLAACGSSSTDSSTDAKGNTIHMNATNFAQTSISLKKGESVTLKSDTMVPHIIANGTWADNSAKPNTEAGAPQINNVQIGGNSSGTIGPFNTSGTFQIYCTIHPGMNLTVTVA